MQAFEKPGGDGEAERQLARADDGDLAFGSEEDLVGRGCGAVTAVEDESGHWSGKTTAGAGGDFREVRRPA